MLNILISHKEEYDLEKFWKIESLYVIQLSDRVYNVTFPA